MLDALVATIALSMPADSSDREWSVNRPSRGAHSSVIQRAAAVPPGLQGFVSCVLRRESGATIDRRSSGQGAINPSSGAAGRWQFMPAWQNGLPYMVRDRLVQFGMPKKQAKQVREYLSARPISQWSGWYQDIGAFEVMERGGRHHWNGGNFAC